MLRSKHGRWVGPIAGASLISLSLCGCANFWDDMTRRDQPFGDRVKGLFSKPNPYVVLRDSHDGDDRASAIRALHEPKQFKGTDEEQTLVVTVLTKEATQASQPLCRLAAIESLSHFKDPRVVQALKDAFYNAGEFSSDVTTRIQCAALIAMGETENPDVIKFLVEKVKEPTAERSDYSQQRTDRCIAAARALAHFKDYPATEALVQILRNEKEDVALHDQVHESLKKATNKDLPPDAQAWDEFLHPKDEKALQDSKPKNYILASWLF